MPNIPPIPKEKWWLTERWNESITGFSTVIIAGLNVWAQWNNANVILIISSWMLLVFGVGFCIWRIARGIAKDRASRAARHPKDLAGCVEVAYQMLALKLSLSVNDNRQVRMTLHSVQFDESKRPSHFEQATPYSGAKGGPPGRTYPINRGLIGVCAREKKPKQFDWDGQDSVAFERKLQTEFNFEPGEAAQMVKAQRCWLVVPLLHNDDCIGVLYVDSRTAEEFDEDTVNLLVDLAGCIVRYVEERYP